MPGVLARLEAAPEWLRPRERLRLVDRQARQAEARRMEAALSMVGLPGRSAEGAAWAVRAQAWAGQQGWTAVRVGMYIQPSGVIRTRVTSQHRSRRSTMQPAWRVATKRSGSSTARMTDRASLGSPIIRSETAARARESRLPQEF